MSRPNPVDSGSRKFQVTGKMVASGVLLLVALIFVFSTLGAGPLHFLVWSFTMPVWIWFLAVLLAGVAIGSLFPWLRPRRRYYRR